jgi:16S rRNA (cytosine967-C5)-methyltransferase
LVLDPVRADELPEGIMPQPGGYVRTLPTMLADRGALDGLFIARFKR